MEDLFPALIVLIGIIGSIVSSSKKDKAKQEAEARRAAAAKARIEAAQQKMKAQAAPYRPAQPSVTVSAPYAAPSGQVITPTVHPHVQPDCETHDIPGSLGFVSTEGKDPCHEPMLTHDRTAEPAAAQQPALTFDWSGDSMVKAVVMQEILTRPAQRRRA